MRPPEGGAEGRPHVRLEEATGCFQEENREVSPIMTIEAYCVKCKAKKEMKDPVESTTKNGKPITKGTCPDCGTTICRIGSAKK
jgi:hypothetical protein